MDPKHHQPRVLDRLPKDLRNPLRRMLVQKSISRKKYIFFLTTYVRFYILFIIICRDRKDKEKDEISRMPKAKDEQAPVSKIN